MANEKDPRVRFAERVGQLHLEVEGQVNDLAIKDSVRLAVQAAIVLYGDEGIWPLVERAREEARRIAHNLCFECGEEPCLPGMSVGRKCFERLEEAEEELPSEEPPITH